MFKSFILILITFPSIVIFFYVIRLLQANNAKRLKAFSYGLFFFFIFSIPATSLFLSIPLKKGGKKLDNTQYNYFNYVVTLTGGIKKNILNDYVPSMATSERVLLANKLSKDYNIPLIISGGATLKNAQSESLVTAKYFNITDSILDQKSLNTYESSLNLRNFCLDDNKFIIITDKWHSLRSYLTFKSQNCDVVTFNYPLNFKLVQFIPTIHGFSDTNRLIYEYAAIIYYILTSKITL